ncbi:sensor histidine kinase [Candidatus Venteria ishoeyi]|uniref:histidine kinase n=1 Tax=Candidatus Venteria ishoeyi TaxID=1899563 RepID=A0A1H6F6Y9_9GAMM|nr:ATP-binding protein [Candidatus Venteria ishoeyi]MDM8548172.1 ATP-binding protein [Candidatus Venteria ishoeyi]SEH05191.1 Non-motile and phage-resistance protein [Candidatus Venteria ishoeyi]
MFDKSWRTRIDTILMSLSQFRLIQKFVALLHLKLLLLLFVLLSVTALWLLQDISTEVEAVQQQASLYYLQNQIDAQKIKLINNLEQAKRTLNRLHGYMDLFAKQTPVKAAIQKQVNTLIKTELSLQNQAYSVFYAFEPETSRRYFNRDAVLINIHKDNKKITSTSYNDPEQFRVRSWKDGNYQSNEREIWYHQGRRNQSMQISPVYYDKNYTRTWLITLSQGIYVRNEFQGVIGVSLLLDSFFSEIESQTFGDSGKLLLFDYISGQLLSRTDNQDSGISLLGSYERLRFNAYKGNTGQSHLWKIVLTQRGDDVLMTGMDDEEYQLLSRPVKDLSWTLVAYQDIQDMRISKQSGEFILWGILLLILTILLVLLSYYSFLRPLKKFTAQLAKVREAQLPLAALDNPHGIHGELIPLCREINTLFTLQQDYLQDCQSTHRACQQQLEVVSERVAYQEKSIEQQEQSLVLIRKQLLNTQQEFGNSQQQLKQTWKKALQLKAYAQKARHLARHAKSEATHAGRAKAQFLANMNHELRTPMNAIIGYTEMLQEDAEEMGQYDFIPDLQKIHGASYHLLDLINNLFDLSKIASSRMDLYLETFDITPMLQDVTATVQPLVEKQGNILKMELEIALGTMNSDLTKLRQNLLNLLNNASKFSKQSSITLRAKRENDQDMEWVIFQIQDEGIGMSSNQVKKLFTGLDSHTTHEFGGSNVGLALCKQFCEIMGGTLKVDSQLGQGSIFTMRLPANSSAMLTK